MSKNVRKHNLYELAHEKNKSEIYLGTKLNTDLHIIVNDYRTIIKLPYGNRFDLVDGTIIIYEK